MCGTSEFRYFLYLFQSALLRIHLMGLRVDAVLVKVKEDGKMISKYYRSANGESNLRMASL